MRNIFVLVLLLFVSASWATYSGNFALSFDGNDDYVSVQHGTADYTLDDFWTVEAWFYPTSTQSYWQLNIAGFPGRHPNLNYCGQQNAQCSPGAPIAQLRSNTGAWFPIIGNPGNSQPNQWHHIAGSWDNTTLSLYIDGVLEKSVNPYSMGFVEGSPCQNFDCDYGFQIGGNYLRTPAGIFSSQYFRGYIDEVRVWKSGRSQQEIQSTMNTPLTGAEPSLVYYWRFDEGHGYETKSLALDAYGLLGGGSMSAQPLWVDSSSPLSQPPPSGEYPPDDHHVTVNEAGAVTAGALISTFVLLGGLAFGFFVGRRTYDRPFPYFWQSSGETQSLISKS